MRRALIWLIATAVVLVALAPVGRWERSRRANEQNEGMGIVLAAVGPLDSPSLSAFRRNENFDCLLYKRDGNPFALELCVDFQARLIEAIDRRAGEPRIWSLRDDRGRSTITVDRAQVERLLERMIEEP